MLGFGTGYDLRSLGNNLSDSFPSQWGLVESVCDIDDDDKPDFGFHRLHLMIGISLTRQRDNMADCSHSVFWLCPTKPQLGMNKNLRRSVFICLSCCIIV